MPGWAVVHPDTTGRSMDTDTRCGLGPCRPQWLQTMANKNVYTLVFAFTQVIQLAYLTYFQSAISTMEKEFGAQTQTVALVMSGNEVSQILCGLGLVYVAARGNRPRWLALSMVVVAAANLVLASPALLLHSHRAPPTSAAVAADTVCGGGGARTEERPLAAGGQSSDSEAAMSAALAIVFAGQFIAGTGFTMVNTLSLSYLDDNINKSVSPLYIGIATGLRLLGPVVGSFLASFCLNIYVSLVDPRHMGHKDPRWVGAWWLGFVIFAGAFAVGAALVVLFPRSLPRKGPLDGEAQTPKSSLQADHKPKGNVKDFKATMKRLLTNKVLLCHAMSRCFHLFGTNGYSAFMPKYLESNFRQTASGASFLAGVSGSLMRMIGILATGLVLRKWKPRTSWVTGWNLALDVVYIGALAALMLFSCPDGSQLIGFDANAKAVDAGSGGGQLGACEGRCDCSAQPFNPVCLDGRNYFSPCHAGCRTTYRINGTKEQMYGNCSCALEDSNATTSGPFAESTWTAVAGYCSSTCAYFQAYLLTVGATKLVMATRKVGRLLITLRCVEEKDKSVALALYAVMESLFAYIPCAVIYGALLDKACILWAGSWGRGGHCWIYDSDFLRYAMHGITMAAFVGGTILDAVVLYQCRKMVLFGGEEDHGPNSVNNNNNEEKEEETCAGSPKVQGHMAEAVSRISID